MSIWTVSDPARWNDPDTWVRPAKVEAQVWDCIQFCHFQLPADASWDERKAELDANAPPWDREGFSWRIWRRCRKAYLNLLWPGKPAPELTPADAPLLFWRGGVTA